MPAVSDLIGFQTAFFDRYPLADSVMRLFDLLPSVSFYAKDMESRFIKANRAFLDNHGLTDERDVLGKTDFDLSPPMMAASYVDEDRRVMAGRAPVPGQVWLVYQLKRVPRWYVSSKTPLFDPFGKVIGIAGAMYPIDRPAELAVYTRELLPVIRHIEQRYAEPISMVDMARLAGVSSTHFNRRFHQLLRTTPRDYLRMVRVQAAQRILVGTHESLASIAAATGFTDQSHFTRRFREVTGMTPNAYRLRFRAEG